MYPGRPASSELLRSSFVVTKAWTIVSTLISGQILPYFINLIEIKPRTLAELSHLLFHSHLFIKDSTNVSNTVNSLNDVSSYSDVGSLYFLKGCFSAKNYKFSFFIVQFELILMHPFTEFINTSFHACKDFRLILSRYEVSIQLRVICIAMDRYIERLYY